jgi:hypothetical protein
MIKKIMKIEELKPVPATLSRKPFFVGHITSDGCAPHYLAPLLKRSVGVEGKTAFRTFLLKCLGCHCLSSLIKISNPQNSQPIKIWRSSSYQ